MDIASYRLRLALALYRLAYLTGLLDSSLGRRCYCWAYTLYKRHIEDSLEWLLQRHPSILCAGDCIDVGSHIGYTAKVLARHAPKDAMIHCFEPTAENRELFQSHCRAELRNGRMRIEPFAVGAKAGTVFIRYNSLHPGDQRVAFSTEGPADQMVALTSLDSYWKTQMDCKAVSLVKIDVQGDEAAVLDGMKEMLERLPMMSIYFEYSTALQEQDRIDIFETLQRSGRELFQVERSGLKRRMSAAEIFLIEGEYTNILATPSGTLTLP